MSKKMIAAAVACVLIIAIVAIVCSNLGKTEVEPAPTAVSTEPAVTEAAETTVPEETYNVSVVESTPNSVTMEISNSGNETSQVQMGGAESGGTGEDLEEDPAATTQTQPQTGEEQDTGNITVPSGVVNTASGPDLTTTYEEYEAMTSEEKLLFYYSFADPDDFFEWLDAAKARYEEENGSIIIGEDGNVDLGG